MINVTGVRLNLIKEIGEISEKKVKIVKDLVCDSLPQMVNLPVGYIFINPETRIHLLLASGQITVAQEGFEISPDFAVLRKLADDVFDILLLDNKANTVVLNYSGLINVENSMVRSRSLINDMNETITIGQIPGITGVGLRFFYNEEGFNGDLKVEPFVQDNNKFFVQLEVSSQIGEHTLDLENIFLAGEKMFNKFTDELASFALELTSKL